MVIEHENAVLCAARYLGTPIALPISEYAKELARRHWIMLSINPHPNEFLKVQRPTLRRLRDQRPSRCPSVISKD
jgi:hypothetical protein